MAPPGKKKKDDRDGTARPGRTRAGTSAPRRPRPADGDGGDQASGDDLPGGLALPGRNLIGPGAEIEPVAPDGEAGRSDATPAELGATRYVHAAFFIGAILIAYLTGKILGLGWNLLADWHAAVHAMPFLLRYGEGQRATLTGLVGVVVGLVAVIQTYRRPGIRRWANDVAAELSRVTWPNKEMVTNGTIIVIVASLIAAAYIALLDQFWGFVTRLIYEA